jgi:hypothetical protein
MQVMKFLQSSVLVMLLSGTTAFAHHPAADIVDEEIYAHIDSVVADTPHATMTFDEMGAGMSVTTITADSLREFEALISSDDLLESVEMLDGVVDVSLSFNDDNSVTMTINQVR